MEESPKLVSDEELQNVFMTFGNFVLIGEPNGDHLDGAVTRIQKHTSRIQNLPTPIGNPYVEIQNPPSSSAAVDPIDNPTSAVAAPAAPVSRKFSSVSNLFALSPATIEMQGIMGSSVTQPPCINIRGRMKSMERNSGFGNLCWGLGMDSCAYNVAEESQIQAETPFSFPFNQISKLISQDDQFISNYDRFMATHRPYLAGMRSYQNPESEIERRVQQLLTCLPFLLDDEEDRYTRFLMELIEKCQDKHYDSIVETIVSNPISFLAAVTGERTGRSNWVCKLIKMLKRSPGAFGITKILAPHFIHVTQVYNLRKVIKECLTTFGNGPNGVLYDEAIRHVKVICIHKEGSKLFQECIFGRIGGQKRIDLLHAIAEAADLLSYDPFGNYVVTQALSLKWEDVNSMIYSKLENEYVSLAQQESGSHVIERCISSSEAGLVSFLKQITSAPDVLPVLAKNRYGNYVIQTAAKKCQEHGLNHLLKELIQCFEPHERKIMRHQYGKHVVDTLRNLAETKKARPTERARSSVVV